MRLELDATVSAPPIQADLQTRKHDESFDLGEARSTLNQGIKAAQSGNRAQARGLLLRATELDPRSESAWLWLASISEYPEELLGFLNHVLDINPENQRAVEWKTATNSLLARTFVQRGIDAVHEDQTDFAAECFQTALEHDDRNAVAWMWMASLSASKEAKVELLERAVAIDPNNEDARAALDDAKSSIRKDRMVDAKSAALAGRKEDALRILDSLLAVEPTSVEAWTMRSHVAESFEEKILCFESILEIDPENVAAKAGRESLLALFGTLGTTDVAESNDTATSTHEVVEENHAVTVAAEVPETNDAVMSTHEAAESHDVATLSHEAESTDGVTDAYEVAETNDEATNATEVYNFANTVFVNATPNDGVDVWTNAVNPFESPAEPVAESTVGETENETLHSDAEPAYTLAAQVEVSAAADAEAELVETHSAEAELVETYAAEAEHVETHAAEAEHVETHSAEAEHVESHSAEVEHAEAHSFDEEYRHAAADDPQAETVEFSYAELYGAQSYDEPKDKPADEPMREDAGMTSDPEIPMPNVDLPALRLRQEADSSADEPVMVPEVPEVRASACPFCSHVNASHEITCGSCSAMLTLSDIEMLLANQNGDTNVIRRAVDEMERQRLLRELGSDELVTLGLGHLNLRNLQFGYSCLSEASRMNPTDVVLAGQVNELHIRLDEIKAQEEAHLRMPKGKSILVVDDSPTVRKLIAGKLEKCGHDVFCANDGVEAMERLENLVPDLVLLDINMPRMDGYQVCKLIRSNDKTKNVTVVMISGKDGFFDKVRGRMAGTTGYITKPFGPETLMKAVEIYLSGEIPEHDEL